jgi:FlaA1/EpsC-like NDP-sugar epimerase
MCAVSWSGARKHNASSRDPVIAYLHSLLRFRRLISVGIHVLLIVLSNVFAFWLRFDGDVPDSYMVLAIRALPWLIAVRLFTFVPFRLFEGHWRYTSLWDLRNIVIGVAVSTGVLYAMTSIIFKHPGYPRSVYIIDAILLVCLMTAVRLTRRIHLGLAKRAGGRRVLIYGAGDAGELIVRDMRQNTRFQAIPLGFVDDDRGKIGQRIHGLPVLGGRADLPRILDLYQPEELLIAIPSISRESLRAVVRAVEPFRIRITTLPRLHELIGVKVEVGQIRQLKVEDLLAREAVSLDYALVREFLRHKHVVVTGAGGSIGSELCRQIASASPASLVLIDRYENGLFQIHHELSARFGGLQLRPVLADITDAKRIQQIFDDVRPQVVFHAAAHKHVPLMEGNPCEAVKNNVRGTRLVAEAALRSGVERFILISTDKAVHPTSVMGATKRVAELIVEQLSNCATTSFAAVRFGNVLGSNGSVVPTFLDQIEKGGPVTVTHPEMKRFFMLIPEAVQLVLNAAAIGDRAPLFVLEMGEQVRVADMARDLIRLSGLVPDQDIEIQFTGMRPGEKLYEELVDDGEMAEPSELDKILRVRTTMAQTRDGLEASIARLEALALEGRPNDVRRELQSLLAEFSPSRPAIAIA